MPVMQIISCIHDVHFSYIFRVLLRMQYLETDFSIEDSCYIFLAQQTSFYRDFSVTVSVLASASVYMFTWFCVSVAKKEYIFKLQGELSHVHAISRSFYFFYMYGECISLEKNVFTQGELFFQEQQVGYQPFPSFLQHLGKKQMI